MFTLSEKLIPGTGSYFAPEKQGNSIFKTVFIGEKLAKDLNIIRYILTAEALNKLEAEGIPAEVIEKLAPLTDQRFTSEKKFTGLSTGYSLRGR